ncbi:NifB/NifX family molybdenum-iron cluster-binding protein [Desulfonatronum thiodismutans]|uniref:NifB/NifX family molybdenum-iron cluster-binding protein n=1 Tax=Desulfonatronum thiodismutans TaxID=159290 RepID=UPI001F2BCD0A|nr:NifB/NifX family molybdenum-iron cluster-binding protein [Desulfonatronum thiodismutans]
MRVCLACYGNRIATLLDTATSLHLYHEQPDGTMRDTPEQMLPGPSHGPEIHVLPSTVRDLGMLGFARTLVQSDVHWLLCGGLACPDREILIYAGLRVEPWIGGRADEVAQAWFAGRVLSYKMPGLGKRNCAVGRGWRRTTKGVRKMQMKRIAVSSEGPLLDDMVDPRFGRAAGFVVVDQVGNASSYIDNGASQVMAQGAGIQAAQNLANAGVEVVISGFVGPKAFQALSAAGIQIIQNVEGVTVGQAVERFKRGELTVADAPNSQAHGGTGRGRGQGSGQGRGQGARR